ncbi:hypothetical protein BGZ63DRAFT_383772 [Mariannaea sp. PMI_226]|nr:hypothetical protein BGZ63DRAFT_383772 [Mariannaea sp. PMI_226]
MIHPKQLTAAALHRPFANILRANCTPSRILFRSSSLSAIHRGLRHSERAQYGAVRPRDTSSDRRRDTPKTRPRRNQSFSVEPKDEFAAKFTTRALDGASSFRQQQKLRKKLAKKKAEEDEEDEDYRRTRRKRFTDPDTPFGKKSLVYRLKHGDLKETATKLDIQEPVKPRSFRDARRDNAQFERRGREESESQFGGTPRRHDRRANTDEQSRWSDRQMDGDRESRWSERRNDRDESSRWTDRRSDRRNDEDRESRWTERRSDRRNNGDRESKWTERRSNRRSDGDRGTRWSEGRSERDMEFEDMPASRAGRKKVMMPMTVKYTTAASQFLYGRSVVKSALEQGRRKLYNLYIYGGDNRRDSKDDTIMTRLAKKHGIPVTIVPNEEQRIMDKMSMGRPHNGFVLEASPLPQRPIKSLGRLEETATRLGFHVELDFQAKEEEAINGTDTFVKRANDMMPKPFVLLLNEIIDPGNLGGILRTASYLGIDAVGITNRGSSTLTPVVLKSAAGAVEEISLFTVDDPLKFIEDSNRAGWKTFAAVAPPDRKLVRKHGEKFISTDEIQTRSPLNDHPCLLVLGNEGHGLPKQLKVAADYEVSVPSFVQGSNVDSLNVSVAAGLLCHSFIKEIKASEDSSFAKSQDVIDLVKKLGRQRKGGEDSTQEEVRVVEGAEQVRKDLEETESKVETEVEKTKDERQDVQGEGRIEEEKKKKREDSDLGF